MSVQSVKCSLIGRVNGVFHIKLDEIIDCFKHYHI